MELVLNTGEFHTITPADAESYRSLYPGIDLDQEIRNMAGWLLANPTRRKTQRGIRRFINSWLSRAQDKGGSPSNIANRQTTLDALCSIDHWEGVDPEVSLKDVATVKLERYGGFIYKGQQFMDLEAFS